tara:strand:+ start:698 stop:1030 length:333 start_codon:yes stop_codon:yes gene_type:complete
MPQVNGKKFPYTDKGMEEAAKQRMSDEDKLRAINILLGTEDATEPQPDFELGATGGAGAMAAPMAAPMGAAGVMTDQEMRNLGNPTSRDFADPEIDKAILRQQKERIFGY